MTAHHPTAEITGDMLDSQTTVLIVVGAHLRAEIEDRPHAYSLHKRLVQWLDQNRDAAADDPASSLRPLVCTDVWYLNDSELQQRPVISIGEPGVNAAAAFLCTHLPTALMIDHTLRVHLDPEFAEPRACLWGANSTATASAIEVFTERYLDAFMREAINR